MDLELRNSFVALRHGQSVANAQRMIVSNPDTGCHGFGLTEEGRIAVANQASSILKICGGSPRILSSDFLGAVQTAEMLAEKSGTQVEVRNELRERWFGDLDQKDNSSYQQVWDQDQCDPSHTQWNVESVESVVERTVGLVRDLNEKFENEVFVLISHSDPIQILTTWFKKVPSASHRELEMVLPGQLQILHLS